MLEIILLLLAGFITGILGALLGIGGGSLLVPILVLFFNYTMHTAVAAALVTNVATSLATAHINLLKGMVNIRLSLLLELITVIAAIIGGFIGNQLNDSLLKIIFGIILILVSLIYIRESLKSKEDTVLTNTSLNIFTDSFYDPEKKENIVYTPHNITLTSIISAIAGLASGMLGIGGGVFKVPAMNLISRIPLKVSIATSNYMIGLTAAGGTIPYLTHGKVLPYLSLNMIIGVIFGSKFAAKKFPKITDKKLRILFAAFLMIISLQMLYKGLK
ncbi:MAG: sulfite exporter TauE/SafE family protein [Deferribacterales bacterium]